MRGMEDDWKRIGRREGKGRNDWEGNDRSEEEKSKGRGEEIRGGLGKE